VVTQDQVQAFLQVSANSDVLLTKPVKSTVIFTIDGMKTTDVSFHPARAFPMIIVVHLRLNHIIGLHLVIIVVSRLRLLQISLVVNTTHILKIIGEMIILDNLKVHHPHPHQHHCHYLSILDKT